LIPQGFPLEVFRRYAGLALPRHVSYPMPTAWSNLDEKDFRDHCALHEKDPDSPGLSIYIHIPFCESLCKFCACSKTILKKELRESAEKKQAYIEALLREIALAASARGMNRPVRQVHWGGGSPSYLEGEEIIAIQAALREHFVLADDAEVSIEIDPRHTTPHLLDCLKQARFNRISMGIQDFDAVVQSHVHRIQPFEMVRDVTEAIRERGIGRVNYDLIYGMPYQTLETVADMVEKTLQLRPDRIAFYHYAQIPEKIATQRGMDYKRLPSSEEKLAMFLNALEKFPAGGYVFIGLDHFALPDDQLAISLDEGTIQRNFQGMTTQRGLDLIGLGASSISHLMGLGYWQSHKDIPVYKASVMNGRMPIERGLHFSEDDRIRQEALSEIYCYGRADLRQVGRRFGIDPMEYFAREWENLRELEQDGLVELPAEGIVQVTHPLGRVLLRNIGAVFDAYLDPDAFKMGDRYYYSVSA